MTNQTHQTPQIQDQTKDQTEDQNDVTTNAAASTRAEITEPEIAKAERNEDALENKEDFDPDLILSREELEAIALSDEADGEFDSNGMGTNEIEEDEFGTDDELDDEPKIEEELETDDGDADDEPDEEDEFDAEDEDDFPVLAPRLDALDAEEKVRLMAGVADAVRAEDIEVLDLRPLTIIADFFLICTGKSSIQLRAIADRIDDRMREAGIRKPRMEGYQEATWILLDYGEVVAHLMAAEQREYYNLEEFWSAAPRLELQLLPDEARALAYANRPTPSRFETLTPIEDGSEI